MASPATSSFGMVWTSFTSSSARTMTVRSPRSRRTRQAYKGVPPVNPVFDFSYDGVMRSVEESLSRLGLDRIDVLHIHDPDDHFDEALTGAYRALDRLRSEGSIRAVGAGMNQSEMLVR